MAQQHGLGRGLSSLIPQKPVDSDAPVAASDKTPVEVAVNSAGLGRAIIEVAVGDIVVNTQQPRLYFDEEKLQELSDSIAEHGILQPLVVVPQGDQYELIAGERRLRASKKAGLKTVPAIVRENFDEVKKLELAIIENVQRADLNVVEEGKAYKKLADDFSLSQEDIAKRTGKSRSVVANRMRLVALPVEIQKGIVEGRITEGHAKAIMALDHPEKQRALYELIIMKGLTVRETEDHTRSASSGSVRAHSRTKKSAEMRSYEEQLTEHFGTRVTLSGSIKKGSVSIKYNSLEELQQILDKGKKSS